MQRKRKKENLEGGSEKRENEIRKEKNLGENESGKKDKKEG